MRAFPAALDPAGDARFPGLAPPLGPARVRDHRGRGALVRARATAARLPSPAGSLSPTARMAARPSGCLHPPRPRRRSSPSCGREAPPFLAPGLAHPRHPVPSRGRRRVGVATRAARGLVPRPALLVGRHEAPTGMGELVRATRRALAAVAHPTAPADVRRPCALPAAGATSNRACPIPILHLNAFEAPTGAQPVPRPPPRASARRVLHLGARGGTGRMGESLAAPSTRCGRSAPSPLPRSPRPARRRCWSSLLA